MTTTSRPLDTAFDPGTTTGVAWLDNGVFGSAQFDEHELYMWVDSHCERIFHAQAESFIVRPRTQVVYDSLYIIGYLRYAAWRCGFDLDFTKPADVMAPFPDEALKRANWHKPGKVHANDAARHLAHRAVRNRSMDASIFLPKGHD